MNRKGQEQRREGKGEVEQGMEKWRKGADRAEGKWRGRREGWIEGGKERRVAK